MLNKFAIFVAGAVCALAMGSFSASADGYVKGGGGSYAGGCDNSNRFSGAFIGLHAGSGSLRNTTTDRDYFSNGSDVTLTKDGFIGGGQVGYNWQKCNTVFGIEADLAFASLDSRRDYDFGYMNFERKIDWLGSIRTKTGLVVGDLFLYATGGIAFMDSSLSVEGDGGYLSGKINSGTRVGWVAGVGTEYALNDRMSITSDVLYYDFGTETGKATYTGCCGGEYRFDDTQSLWVARMGLNFRLGAREVAYEPMK